MNKIINDITSNSKPYESSKNIKWGFTQSSEKINGRIAMLSFILVILIELITKHNLIDLITSTTIH